MFCTNGFGGYGQMNKIAQDLFSFIKMSIIDQFEEYIRNFTNFNLWLRISCENSQNYSYSATGHFRVWTAGNFESAALVAATNRKSYHHCNRTVFSCWSYRSINIENTRGGNLETGRGWLGRRRWSLWTTRGRRRRRRPVMTTCRSQSWHDWDCSFLSFEMMALINALVFLVFMPLCCD